MILTWVSPHIVVCICQIVTLGWLSWGQAGLTSALLALWPEQRRGLGARTDIPAETLLHYTLNCADQQRYCTLWGQCLALEWLCQCSWKQIQHPHRYPRPHQWLLARVISVNCRMITFLVGIGEYMYFGISLQLPNLYRICWVGSLFLN